jgi:hypothetical protein
MVESFSEAKTLFLVYAASLSAVPKTTGKTTMITDTWPIGTCFFTQLPAGIQSALMEHVIDGAVEATEDLKIHFTATEGPYISFAGWKVRAKITETSPTTYIVELA